MRSHLPRAYIEIEVRDKNGKIIHRHQQPARSWVKNFMKILLCGLGATNVTVTKQDGSSGTIGYSTAIADVLSVKAGSGDHTWGIIVGNGSKAFDVEDYCLESKIPHGNESGKLAYDEVTVESLIDDGQKLYFRVIRTFTNNSGGDITVSEVGLATYHGVHPLIARDLLETPATVPNGGTLTVRYIIQYQYA